MAVLSENPQETAGGIPAGHDCNVPAVDGADAECAARVRGRSHRQLLVCVRPHAWQELSAAGRRVHLHRPGLFIRRTAGNE